MQVQTSEQYHIGRVAYNQAGFTHHFEPSQPSVVFCMQAEVALQSAGPLLEKVSLISEEPTLMERVALVLHPSYALKGTLHPSCVLKHTLHPSDALTHTLHPCYDLKRTLRPS